MTVEMKKLDAIEFLRATAILLVVLFHVSPSIMPSGFVGVDIFLTISGYVVARSILRRLHRNERFSLQGFLARRVRRLFPPLGFAALFTLPILALTQSPLGSFHISFQTLISSIFGVSNGVIQYVNGGYFGSEAKLNGYLHTWSLSVEVQFYIILGLVGLITLTRLGKTSRKYFVSSLVAMGLISLGILLLSIVYELPFEELGLFGYYSPVTRLWQFVIGAAIAVFLGTSQVRVSFVTSGLMAILFAALSDLQAVLSFGVSLSSAIASIGAALIIAGVGENEFSKWTLPKVFRTIGSLSYTWYLLHWPLIVAANTLNDSDLSRFAAALLSLAISYAYTYLFEAKTMQGVLQTPISALVNKSLIAALAVTSLVTVTLALSDFGDYQITQYRIQANERHLPSKISWLCATGPLSADNYRECLIEGQPGTKPIYLVGDSQAGHISEAVTQAGEAQGRSVLVSTTTSCPFYNQNGKDERCDKFHDRTIELLLSRELGTVIIAFSSSNKLTDETLESLDQTLSALITRGHHVVLVGPIPWAASDLYFNPRECSLESVRSRSCFISLPVELISSEAMEQESAFSEMSESGSVSFISLIELLCSDTYCPTLRDGVLIYRDPSHLSVASNGLLVESFAGVFSKY